MATSNTYNATFGGHPFTLAFNWSLASQNIPGNYSTISWNLQVIKTGNYTPYNNTSSPTWATNITSGNWGPYNFNGAIGQTITIASGSYNIGHASDGTGSISVSFNANAISTITTASGSGSDTLPTIARATVPTVSPTSGNFGTAYTITVNPASSSFYHNIDYSLDGGTTWTNIVTNLAGTTTTQNWTPAATLLPNATDVTAIIRATTLTGSGGSTIGTNNVSLPLHVDNTIIPTVSGVAWVDTQTSAPDIPTLMGGTGRYVQGWSKLQPTVTSAGASGSTITSSTVTQGSQVTASGTAFTNPVTLSGAVPYSAIATDSRLRTSAAYTNTVAVTAYAFPNLPVPAIQRTSDAAGLIPSPTGTYLRITPTASVSDLTFATVQKNTIEYQIRVKPTGGSFTTVAAWTATGTSGVTWTTPVVIAGYASTTEWQVEVSLRDKFGNLGYNTGSTVAVQNVVVPTEAVFMDWDGNAGIGIGKYHTNGQLDLSGQIYQNNGGVVASRGEPARLLPGSPGGQRSYTRIATIDGVSVYNGGDLEFFLSGLGNYGVQGRTTVLVHGTQRGSNNVDLQSWAFGVDETTEPPQLFTRQTGSLVFEIWLYGSSFQSTAEITVLSGWNYTLNLDSVSGTAPTSLVNWPLGAGGIAAGNIEMTVRGSAPAGWLLCDGAAYSRTSYAHLFAVIGTTFGAGDGSTTFNLPNLKGRAPVGVDSGQSEFSTLGGVGGEKTHLLTIAEMPPHNHNPAVIVDATPLKWSTAAAGSGVGTLSSSGGTNVVATSSTGGNGAHNNLQPYMALNFIIKY